MLAAFYDKGPNQFGLFAVLRSQTTNETSVPYSDYANNIVAGAIDVAGHFAEPLPGNPFTYIYGAGEVAFIVGSTKIELRSADQALSGQQTLIAVCMEARGQLGFRA